MSHIIFLHGNNQLASRKKLSDLVDLAKKEQKEVVWLDGKTTSLTDIKQALEAQSLFGVSRLVIIESLFSRQKSKEKESIINYLKKEEITLSLVLWEAKPIDGRSLKGFPPKWQIMLFKTPVVIFKFLDSIRPGNNKQMLTLIEQSQRVDSSEMVFYMLASRIRQLIIALDTGKNGLKGAPWQIGKLVSQAKNFSLEELIGIYKELLRIDVDIKTGRSFMPLNWHLDTLVSRL